MKQLTVLWLLVALNALATIGLIVRIQTVQAHQNDGLHAIICYAQHAVQIRPDIPPKQRREALAFYSHALGIANLKPCN